MIEKATASFDELAQQGGLPAFTTNGTRDRNRWRRPYVNIGTTVNDYLTDVFGPPAVPTITGVPMGVHAVRVVRTVNPQAGTVVARDTIVVRPSSTTPAGLWF